GDVAGSATALHTVEAERAQVAAGPADTADAPRRAAALVAVRARGSRRAALVARPGRTVPGAARGIGCARGYVLQTTIDLEGTIREPPERSWPGGSGPTRYRRTEVAGWPVGLDARVPLRRAARVVRLAPAERAHGRWIAAPRGVGARHQARGDQLRRA